MKFTVIYLACTRVGKLSEASDFRSTADPGVLVVSSDFLRLGLPLFCAAEDEELYDSKRLADTGSCPTFAAALDKIQDSSSTSSLRQLALESPVARRPRPNGGPVPLTRVKCLVSMTTPRDVRLHGAAITPSFVEFDMSSEGFGCIYLPSIAPQALSSPSVVSAGMIGGTDQGVVGGIGSGNGSTIYFILLSHSVYGIRFHIFFSLFIRDFYQCFFYQCLDFY